MNQKFHTHSLRHRLRRVLPEMGLAALPSTLAVLLILISGCGGGSSAPPGPAPSGPAIGQFKAERSTYFVGEQARLTVVYTGGTGRIEPGSIPVASGATVATPALGKDTTFRLVVTDGTASVERELAIEVDYRERMRSIQVPFARAEHAALTMADGRVLILGGDAGGTTLPDTVYAFDPDTETFSVAGALASGRVGFTAVTLGGDKVLVSGGAIALTQAPLAEIFDAATGSSVPAAAAPRRLRYHASATLLADGKVLIVGGMTGAGLDPSAELYDPATGTFAFTAGNLSVGRGGHTATRLADGRVLVYGGFTVSGAAAPPELYDPGTGTFTSVAAPEITVRGNHTAIRAANGSVWIVGGENTDLSPLVSVLRFNPHDASFSPVLNLATPRTLLAAAELNDDRLLVAGGLTSVSSGDATDTTELAAPSGLRRDGPPMQAARQMHSVTRLGNGKVLILGGLDRNRQVLASAEIFE